jgi:ABC-type sugar transport system ATPase subunit
VAVESSPQGTGAAGTGQAGAVDTAVPVLRVEHMSKTFPGTKALDDVTLEIAQGEIHALVGQNGSGKSTLIKVLAGYHRADRGTQVWLNGDPFDVAHTSNASHQRLRFVHQDLGLFLELNAVDNLALRGEFLLDPIHRVKWKAQTDLTRDLLGRFDLDLDVSRPMSEATPVQRTIVAIAAALAGWEGGAGVLVLDEPTAVLPPHDVARLLEIVDRVRSRGTSILYVSHRLDEVFRVADRVTVLRGGKVVASRPTEGLNAQLLAELMVGSDVDASFRADVSTRVESPVVLRARDICGRFLDGVDVDLHEGEILGVAGLPGSGRNELPYAIAGAMKDATGHLELENGPQIPLRKAQSLDIPIVPADRAREASLDEFSVAENISVSILGRVSSGGIVRRRAERSVVDRWMKTINVKEGSERNPITTLSGGNQQKVIMARCLARDPRVLLLCEPTAGVDVGTRQAIYEFIAERAKAGLSLIVSSSDTGDLLAICTRVLVMCNGRVVRELVGSEITEQALLHAMEETEQV